MGKLSGYRMTFETVQVVRDELATAVQAGDKIAATDALERLVALYASIDAGSMVEALAEAELATNVVRVDFSPRRKAA
jgi:hypothetical protein